MNFYYKKLIFFFLILFFFSDYECITVIMKINNYGNLKSYI